MKPLVWVLAVMLVATASCTTVIRRVVVPTPAGTTGTRVAPAPVWSSAILYGHANDWEPTVAADPGAPYVYAVTTRLDVDDRACFGCPVPIVLRRSDDGGTTWGDSTFICPCRGEHEGQGDPQIRTDGAGHVFATWMADELRVTFSRSDDHGQTWSKPIDITGSKGSTGDHPWLTVSSDGRDVYSAFNHGDSYVAASHDGGHTWLKPVKTNSAPQGQYFHKGGVVLADGTVLLVATVFACCKHGELSLGQPVNVVLLRSTDGGASWLQTTVDTMSAPPPCHGKQCRPAQYGPQASIAADAGGHLIIAYNGGTVPYGGEQIWVRSSSNEGRTWSDRTALSPAGDIVAGFPAIAGTGSGDFRLIWADDRNGPGAVNVWYRRTIDDGASWTDAVDISNAQGRSYQRPDGFTYFYGDYGDIAITNTGETVAVWGEGPNLKGPGTTWIAVGK
jgi:hypothetical protein